MSGRLSEILDYRKLIWTCNTVSVLKYKSLSINGFSQDKDKTKNETSILFYYYFYCYVI
jgi:hypothetical protein